MGPYFEVFSRILIYMWGSYHTEPLDTGRQRHWASNTSARPLSRLNDLTRGDVQHLMVERLKDDPNFLLCGDADLLTSTPGFG